MSVSGSEVYNGHWCRLADLKIVVQDFLTLSLDNFKFWELVGFLLNLSL